MKVLPQTLPAAAPIPGVAHATWAGADDGLTQLSLWRQTLAPGAATPPHHHDCDEVVLCHAGRGRVTAGAREWHFKAGDTVVLPRGEAHQLFNDGDEPLELLAAFGATPVATYGPDGGAMALPWRT